MYFELNENENTACQNSQHVTQQYVKEIYSTNACVRKEEKFQAKYLTFYLKKLGKEEQIILKVKRRKETIKTRMEFNEIQEQKNKRENQ